MPSLSKALDDYKEEARYHRNRALKALEEGDHERAQSEFAQARACVKKALTYLEELGKPELSVSGKASEAEAEVAREFSDCLGILGGIYRSEGKFKQAICKYREGYQYEANERFNLSSSYNRVNYLIVSILDDPTLLMASGPATEVDPQHKRTMRELLGEADETINQQLSKGRPDRAWAYADLALMRLLRGEEEARVHDALQGLERASDESRDKYFTYESLLKVIRDLAQKPLPVHDGLVAVGEWLRKKLPPGKRGESFSVRSRRSNRGGSCRA